MKRILASMILLTLIIISSANAQVTVPPDIRAMFLEMPEPASLHDTVGQVYLRTGQLDLADQHMRKALAMVDRTDASWALITYHAAELADKQGHKERARSLRHRIKQSGATQGLSDAQVRKLGR